jgi:hypothetical protein
MRVLKMMIIVIDWTGGNFLKDTPYYHKQEIEGTEEDALRIVSELFKLKKNVMISRAALNTIHIFVDYMRFQQR